MNGKKSRNGFGPTEVEGSHFEALERLMDAAENLAAGCNLEDVRVSADVDGQRVSARSGTWNRDTDCVRTTGTIQVHRVKNKEGR